MSELAVVGQTVLGSGLRLFFCPSESPQGWSVRPVQQKIRYRYSFWLLCSAWAIWYGLVWPVPLGDGVVQENV